MIRHIAPGEHFTQLGGIMQTVNPMEFYGRTVALQFDEPREYVESAGLNGVNELANTLTLFDLFLKA